MPAVGKLLKTALAFGDHVATVHDTPRSRKQEQGTRRLRALLQDQRHQEFVRLREAARLQKLRDADFWAKLERSAKKGPPVRSILKLPIASLRATRFHEWGKCECCHVESRPMWRFNLDQRGRPKIKVCSTCRWKLLRRRSKGDAMFRTVPGSFGARQ